MNSLRHGSHGATKSELDLLLVPDTQISVISGKWIEIPKEGTLDGDGPVVFSIPKSSSYIDLANSYAFFQFQIVDSTGTALTSTSTVKVAPVNNFGHSAFQKVAVELGDTTITESTNMYPYRAFFETILNENQDSINSKATLALFYKDTSNKFDTFASTNIGWSKRNELTKTSKVFECFLKLHSDIFFQERYILSDLPIRITLSRSDPKFCLHSDTEGLKFKILDAIFYARQVQVNPEIMAAHAMALEKATAKYPINKVQMKMFNVNDAITSHTEILTSGVLPNRVVFGLVENDAFTGNIKKSPFNFQNCGISNVRLKVNGSDVHEIDLDFTNKKSVRGFSTLFTGIDTWHSGNSINREEWEDGYTLFAFDLTSDLCAGNHLDLLTSGTLTLEMTFQNALSKTYSCIVYMEYQKIIEITKDRKVILDVTS